MPNITCPVCGEVNSADQEFCQYCQSRLQPLDGMLKDADAPITPGQFPTKKVTAELEPILPQWLRDARDKARKTAEEQAANETESQPNASPPDLLAGLQSQKEDEEEETPDWLANITGSKTTPKKVGTGPMEVHWVELGKPDEFMHEEEKGISATQEPTPSANEGELPSWLAGIEPAEGGVDELSQWLREANSRREDLPAEKPARTTEPDSGSRPEAITPSIAETPDWLKNLQEEQPIESDVPQMESSKPAEADDSHWLKDLQAQQAESRMDSDEKSEPLSTELPAWLKDEAAPTDVPASDMPDWIQSSPFVSEEPAQDNIPDWLKAAAPKSSVFSEEPGPATPPAAEAREWLTSLQKDEARETPTPAAASSETPDWLASLQKDATSQPFEPETPEEGTQPPAFVDEALAGLNTESLFTELPDWLANAGGAEQPETPSTTPSSAPAGSEPLTPGELPSWVQAMRPVETSQTPVSSGGEGTPETRGALAGLHGVLPAVPMVTATSKPKSYSIMLQASEEQQAHSTLLEQILAAETAPEPIASFSPLVTQRVLRWLLGFLLLIIVGGGLLLRTGIFSLPSYTPDKLPPEVSDAITATNSIPDGAPVLVVMDYEPALAGEMEATASPLVNTLVSKHATLAFISTSPTGGLLAERLFSGPLRGSNYVRGTNYLNLGYLPGGLMGIRAFARNPEAAMPLDMDRNPIPLQGITSLSQFSVMIVITDNAESARTWIEQAGGITPMVMVSSAQAAPMIEPYYDSRQVNGVVSGLYGGAVFEQTNAGAPSFARTYWDTFSIGLILAAVLILGGGLWNLTLGARERAEAEGR